MNNQETEKYVYENDLLHPNNHHLIPAEVQEILDKQNENTYELCQQVVDQLKLLGWAIDYELDAQFINLRKIDHGQQEVH
jgi:hypothetical protein